MLYRVEEGRAVATRSPPACAATAWSRSPQGLAAGDTVVVNGHVRLRDQAQVEVVQPAGQG